MIKSNFIVALNLVVILMASMSYINEIEPEIPETFSFPKIIDASKIKKLEVTDEKETNHGYHYPFYLGQLKDTITVKGHVYAYNEQKIIKYDNDSIYFETPTKSIYYNYFTDYYNRKNIKKRDSTAFFIKVDTSQTINNLGKKAYPVLILNESKYTSYIGFGGLIPVITEAKNKAGMWIPIERRFLFMCATGLKSIILPPNEIVLTSALVYTGNFKTQLRLKFGNNYSNVFEGTINDSQFEY